MNKTKAAVVIGISCMLLTIAIIVQLKTVESLNKVVGQGHDANELKNQVIKVIGEYDKTSNGKNNIMEQLIEIAGIVKVNIIENLNEPEEYKNSELRDEVFKAIERCNNTEKERDNAKAKLSEIIDSATSDNSELEQIREQIKLNNNLLGLTKLEGPGVEVTLKDDPNATPESVGIFEDISNHIVHYFDVVYVVNELKNAGAEAISVNGQRIVSTTAITCVGNVIKINDEKVGSPFVIKAIGFPEMLASSLTKGGGYLQYINEYVETDVKKMDKVEIPKYTGVFQSKYMRTIQ